jgi:hypothetical protein
MLDIKDTKKKNWDMVMLANIADVVERNQRPRPDGSIDWSKASAEIVEILNYDRTKRLEEVITMIEVEMPTEDEIDDNDEGERYVAPVLERIQEALSKLK